MLPPTNLCGSCLYFKATPVDSTAGACHRYPPLRDNHWPQVPADESCGEFKTQPPVAETKPAHAQSSAARRTA